MLLTTHYMDEAERLCNRVAIVNAGQVIALGTPRELIASLGGEHVIEFALLAENNGELPAETFAALPAVARAERDESLQPVGGRTARGAAGALGLARRSRPGLGQPDDEARQSRRRVRTPGGPAYQ